MKRFSEQLNKKAHSIKLRSAERIDLHDRLVSYMEYHPLPASLKTKPMSHAGLRHASVMVSEPFRVIAIQLKYVRAIAGVLGLFVLVGIPLIAEHSLPGDVLYPMKTDITEELRSQLTFSPYAKIEWDTTRLERRVSEARLLASEGRLTPQTEATVAQAVKDHTSAAQADIATLRQSNPDAAAIAEISFASALAVQSQVLAGSDASSTTEGHSLALLAGTVNQASAAANVTQADAKPSYDSLLAHVQTDVTNAYALLKTIEEQASTTDVSDIQRRLADVERKIAAATAMHNGTATGTATTTLQTATSTTIDATSTHVTTTGTTSSDMLTTDITTMDATNTPAVSGIVTVPIATGTTTTGTTTKLDPAIPVLRSALIDIRKIISFMTDIDVRASVPMNTLVPVTPTDDERAATVQTEISDAQALFTQSAKVKVHGAIGQKVAIASSTLATHLQDATVALSIGQLTQAESAASDALQMAKDLATLVGVAVPAENPATSSVTTDATATSTKTTKTTETATTSKAH